MKRLYPFDVTNSKLDQDLLKQIIFHEAGHAAAIHLYNKQMQLPPVYFQISIHKAKPSNTDLVTDKAPTADHYISEIEGGCLIQSLPVLLMESAKYCLPDDYDTYRTAFEADMINLLVGPLAEAKHVALRDNECFTKNLTTIHSLQYYGGQSDLDKVYEYLEHLISDSKLHEVKLTELFDKAFQFIESPLHWKAIERLAAYLLDSTKTTVSSEEAMVVLNGDASCSGNSWLKLSV